MVCHAAEAAAVMLCQTPDRNSTAAVNFCLAAEKNSAMEDWALLRNAAADATAFCAATMT